MAVLSTGGRRGLIALGTVLLLALAGWALLRPAGSTAVGDPDDLSDVVIVVGTPNKTGLRRQLIASGEAENLPYTVKWAVFDSTPPLTEALKAGQVDIGGGGETGVLFALANGARISPLAGTISDSADSKSDLLVPKDSPARSLADLRGRKIAISYRTAQYYQLAKAFDQLGLERDRKLLLNLNTVDGLSALLNHQVDAVVLWDPNAAIAEVQFGARGIASLRSVVPTAGMLYAATASVQDPRKNRALKDLVRRIVRAQHWVDTHPDQWAQEMAKQAQIPLAAAQLAISRGRTHYVPATDADVQQRWQREIDYFHEQGEFRHPFLIRDHIAPGFDRVVADEVARLRAGGTVAGQAAGKAAS
ncbi:ABC transporter substrate-binding protein [Sphingobium sufflavum]|uniref:PhnD/SsuA/transferrin family substrate-binding protein n=1 Tax=Sphingobium sufflavum TaxID=1129547 RepID=UPI001F2EF7E6|nr:PhnD/SsuA/transferrin family substrate-binding protein [Sphingobium sufflavum]MCE7796138.1 ABC transporter substrate-binding protein [Sphingobium sufflavum]